ncbi:hypothetical protein Tco_0330871 [Tanacetum coccineum]
MHIRASNSELVKPLLKPERTLNRRRRRRNRRVPFDQRNNPHKNPIIVYPPIPDINHIRHFLVTLENLYPMDDEPMWAADHGVAPTPGLQSLFLKLLTIAYKLLEDKVLLKLDWAKNQKTKPSLKKTVAFADEGSSNSNTDKIMARMDAMTLKMDSQYKELQNLYKTTPYLDDDDYLCPEKKLQQPHHIQEAKFMQNFSLADKQSGQPSGSLPSNTKPNPKGHNSKVYQPPQSRNEHVNAIFTRSGKSYNPPVNSNDQQTNHENPINFDNSDEEDEEPTPQSKIQNPKPVKETTLPKPYKPKIPIVEICSLKFGKFHLSVDLGRHFLHMLMAIIRVKLENNQPWSGTERMIFNYRFAMKHSYSNDDTCFSIDVIDEILEEDFNALLNEGGKILHSIKGTLLEEEIFAEFDNFLAMIADENSDSESDTKDQPFKKIAINTDYKIKTSLEEPPTDLELKPLPDNLEYRPDQAENSSCSGSTKELR